MAVAIVARAALRVLSLIVNARPGDAGTFSSAIALSCFRAAAMARWVTAKYPAHGNKLRDAAAAAAAGLVSLLSLASIPALSSARPITPPFPLALLFPPLTSQPFSSPVMPSAAPARCCYGHEHGVGCRRRFCCCNYGC